MAWSDAARAAALEVRRRRGKAPRAGTAASMKRISMARSIRASRNAMRGAGYKVLGTKGQAAGPSPKIAREYLNIKKGTTSTYLVDSSKGYNAQHSPKWKRSYNKELRRVKKFGYP